jgi:hypothetical protein
LTPRRRGPGEFAEHASIAKPEPAKGKGGNEGKGKKKGG